MPALNHNLGHVEASGFGSAGINIGINIPSGEFIIVLGGTQFSNTPNNTVIDTATTPNTYTRAINSTFPSELYIGASNIVTALAPGNRITYTADNLSTPTSVVMASFTGMKSNADASFYAQASANASSITSGSITAGDLAVLVAVPTNSTSGITGPGGNWLPLFVGSYIAAWYQVPNSTGTLSATVSYSPTGGKIGIAAYPSAGGKKIKMII